MDGDNKARTLTVAERLALVLESSGLSAATEFSAPEDFYGMMQRFYEQLGKLDDMTAATAAKTVLEVAKRCGQPFGKAQIKKLQKLVPVPGVDGPRRLVDTDLELTVSQTGEHLPTRANAIDILSNEPAWAGVFGYDTMTEEEVFTSEPPFTRHSAGAMTAIDMGSIATWLERSKFKVHFKVSNEDLASAVAELCRRNQVNRAVEAIEAVAWDGVPRLDMMLFAYLGAESHDESTPQGIAHNEYVSEVGKRWMIGAIARLFSPGCQMDTMLVLESPEQGIKKTSFARALCPEYFSNSLPKKLAEKDAMRHVRDKWIVEMGEMHAMSDEKVAEVKHFLTKRDDTYDDKYVRREQKHLRKCVFLGTTNKAQYLRDTTGNRRFWPVRVTRVDLAQVEADRMQLWAEALHLFRAGHPWHFRPEDARDVAIERQAGIEQAERMVLDDWHDMLHDYLATRQGYIVRWTSLHTSVGFLSASQVKKPDSARIKETVEKLGWLYGSHRGTTEGAHGLEAGVFRGFKFCGPEVLA